VLGKGGKKRIIHLRKGCESERKGEKMKKNGGQKQGRVVFSKKTGKTSVSAEYTGSGNYRFVGQSE